VPTESNRKLHLKCAISEFKVMYFSTLKCICSLLGKRQDASSQFTQVYTVIATQGMNCRTARAGNIHGLPATQYSIFFSPKKKHKKNQVCSICILKQFLISGNIANRRSFHGISYFSSHRMRNEKRKQISVQL